MALHLIVPTARQGQIALLASISPATFSELATLLHDGAEALVNFRQIHEATSSFSEGAEEAAEIIQGLFPLLVSYIAEGELPSSVTSAVVASIRRNKKRTFLKTAAEQSIFKQRLSQLLSDRALALKSKAMLLVGERPSLLHEAKIVTDLRPVFSVSRNAKNSVEAFLVMHTLALTCFQDGTHKKHYIALDTKDLKDLAATVQRALEKDKTLSRVVESAGVARIEVS